MKNPNIWPIVPFLALGDYRAVRRMDRLQEAGVTHILNVRESCRFDVLERFQLLHRPLSDEGGSVLAEVLPECFAFIEAARVGGGVCLVHCHAGVNRSASVVVAYLVQHGGRTLREALVEVATRRGGIQPHEAYARQLLELELKARGENSLTLAEVMPILVALGSPP